MKHLDNQVVANNSAVSFLQFFKLIVPLTLICVSILWYDLEDFLHLGAIVPLILSGFVLNTWLPEKLRLPLLFTLSVAGIYLVSDSFMVTALATALSLGLIALAHIPISFNNRLILIGLAVIGLVILRLNIKEDIPTRVVSIVAPLFMFRMILYLYEIRFEKEEVPIWKRVTYFFMLPNIVFPIFPVVDYKTFKRGYYNEPAFMIYGKGIRWMARGVIHLFAYRIIYHYFLNSPDEISSIYDVVQYMFLSYALIIRLSGMFHFSVGLLCLFGFNLPEVFNNYFLATSFNDLWRRINTYWREFLMKVFYYPIYFKFKKLDANTNIILTTLIIFFINWLLHTYQWFWIKGFFYILPNDFIFWTVFGIAVAINAIWQKNHSRQKETSNTLKYAFTQALKVSGMLVFICVLWSLWISPSFKDWLTIMGFTIKAPIADIAVVLSFGGLGIVIMGILYYVAPTTIAPGLKWVEKQNSSFVLTTFLFLGIVALGADSINRPIKKMARKSGVDLTYLFEAKLNAQDMEHLFTGYYENLVTGNSISSQTWELTKERPPNWEPLHETGAIILDSTHTYRILVPDTSLEFKGQKITANYLGMRDKAYPVEKPEDHLRMVLLGGSVEMGSGVPDQTSYEAQLEELLNQNRVFSEYDSVEILNLALSSGHLVENLHTCFTRAVPLDPDVIIYTAHKEEKKRIIKNFARMIDYGIEMPYPWIQEIIQKEGLDSSMSRPVMIKKLKPYTDEVLRWGYATLAQHCRDNGMTPIWIYLPNYAEKAKKKEYEEIIAIAREEGFVVFDLYNLNEGLNISDFTIASWDQHPNVKAHTKIAKRLLELFTEQKDAILGPVDRSKSKDPLRVKSEVID